MKQNILNTILTAITIGLVFIACEKDENETKISYYNSTKSHKAGQNCMNCHKSGGSGEGWFTVAGTVYDSTKTSIYPNATIKLYTSPNGVGVLAATIQVDEKGNFYTTEHIDFSNGLYTLAEGNLNTMHMNSAITNGECNSCHGVSTEKIWIK